MEQRAWTVDGLKGPKYLAGVGIGVSGDRLTLKHESGTSLVSKCKSHYGPWDLIHLRLLQGSISFTVDLSKVGCACNLAFYLVSAPARDVDGIPIAGNNTYAPGNYYCDANKVGGQWCPEVDIMEANNHAFQATPHKCDPPVGDRHYAHCDRAGCSQNTRFMDRAYGPGPGFGIDTTQSFRVHTEFAGHDGTLTGMTTILRQMDRQVVLDHSNCDPGYYAALSQALGSGMSLRVTYWGDNASTMAWMDTPPCNGGVCSGDNAGPGVISNVVVKSGPELRPPERPGSQASTAPKSPRVEFDCADGLSSWKKDWSPIKIAYCCVHGGSSCASSPRRTGPIKWSNHPSKCLTIARAAGSTTIKASDYSLIVWDCEGGDVGASQSFVSHGDGLIRWSAHPDICMDARGPLGVLNGTFLKFAECAGPNEDRSSQTFKFPSSSTKIWRSSHSNVCVDIANHSGVNGNRVQLWKCLPDDGDQVMTWDVTVGSSAAPAPLPAPATPAPATAAPATAAPTQPPEQPPEPPSTVVTTTSSSPRIYDCLAGRGELARKAWSYRKKLWCCRHMKEGCPVRIPAVWVYDPVVPYPGHIRASPNYTGPRTNAMLKPGETFRVSQGLEGSNGILYLKLADGRGWFFDRMPGVGVMCVEYRVPKMPDSHFSCAIWYTGIEKSWSKQQKQFCCHQAGRGCPAQRITYSQPLILHEPIKTQTAAPIAVLEYDCSVGYRDAATSWDSDKRSWCCLHRGVGCVTTTGLMPSALADSTDCHQGWGWNWGWPWRRGGSCRSKRADGSAGFSQAFEQQRPVRSGSGTALLYISLAAGCCLSLLGVAVLLTKRVRRRLRRVERPPHFLLETAD